jgi:hypothetical protein
MAVGAVRPLWGDLLGRAVCDRIVVLVRGQGVAQRPSGARLAPCRRARFAIRPVGGRPGRSPVVFEGGSGARGRSPRRLSGRSGTAG